MTHDFDPTRLTELREAQGWTQEELALASGLSARTVQRLEAGQGGSLDSWKAVAAAFDVDLSALRQPARRPLHSRRDWNQAQLGVTLGCMGGLTGCVFGWAGLAEQPSVFAAIRHAPLSMGLLIVMTAVCLLMPAVFWRYARRQPTLP